MTKKDIALAIGSFVLGIADGVCLCRLYDRKKKGTKKPKQKHLLIPDAIANEKPEPDEAPKVEFETAASEEDDTIQTPPVVFSPAEQLDIPEIEDLVEEYGGKPPIDEDQEKDAPVPRRPYLIEEENYDEDKIYKKRELNLYLGDGVVTDEKDNEVNNWKALVGVDALRQIEAFGERCVFVRNEATFEDFMILAIDASYGGEDG